VTISVEGWWQGQYEKDHVLIYLSHILPGQIACQCPSQKGINMLLPRRQITRRKLCFYYTCKFRVISIQYVIIYNYWLWNMLLSGIRVITKLPNSEQSYKGKFKIIKYINRQNQSTTGKMWKRNDPNLVQAFLKKWWVESDFKASNLPLSLRFKASGCYYNSIYNNTWTKQVKQLSKQHQAQWRHFYVTHW
jgi:hypothetical protein